MCVKGTSQYRSACHYVKCMDDLREGDAQANQANECCDTVCASCDNHQIHAVRHRSTLTIEHCLARCKACIQHANEDRHVSTQMFPTGRDDHTYLTGHYGELISLASCQVYSC